MKTAYFEHIGALRDLPTCRGKASSLAYDTGDDSIGVAKIAAQLKTVQLDQNSLETFARRQ